MKKQLSSLKNNQHGLAHVFLLGMLVVVSIAMYGTYRVVSSSADTNRGIVQVNSEEGCWLAGRVWGKSGPKDKTKSCQPRCRIKDTNYLEKNENRLGYCKGHVAVQATLEQCITKRHRYYIDNLGCARRANQNDGVAKRYCLPGYPYYNADYTNAAEDKETLVDFCEQSKQVARQNQRSGTPGQVKSDNTTSPNNQPNAPANSGSNNGSNSGSSGSQNTNTQGSNGSSSSGSNGGNSNNSSSSGQSSGPSTITVASYNILTSSRATKLGGAAGYDRKDEVRMTGIANLITERTLDIVGTQEVRPVERRALLNRLPSYYAASPNDKNGRSIDDVVFWDSRKFTMKSYGIYTIPKLGTTRNSVWVKLESKATGNSVVVYSMHADLNAGGRARGASTALGEIRKHIQAKDTRIIVTGDMNSNEFAKDRDQVFRQFNASKMLDYTLTIAKEKYNVNCDTQSSPDDGKQDCHNGRGSHIDQIWVTRGSAEVLRWSNVANQDTIKYSDHNPVIVTMRMKGL